MLPNRRTAPRPNGRHAFALGRNLTLVGLSRGETTCLTVADLDRGHGRGFRPGRRGPARSPPTGPGRAARTPSLLAQCDEAAAGVDQDRLNRAVLLQDHLDDIIMVAPSAALMVFRKVLDGAGGESPVDREHHLPLNRRLCRICSGLPGRSPLPKFNALRPPSARGHSARGCLTRLTVGESLRA
jgi:hypothetical protein